VKPLGQESELEVSEQVATRMNVPEAGGEPKVTVSVSLPPYSTGAT
jgi:hypothetical protein